MRTECNPEPLLFAPVDGRAVVASFDDGAITSDAGALLLGATDRAIDLVGRFAACFSDAAIASASRTRFRRSWPSASSGSRSALGIREPRGLARWLAVDRHHANTIAPPKQQP